MASEGGISTWVWVVAAIVGGLLLVVCACGGLLFFVVDRTLDAPYFDLAMERVNAHEQAVELLGQPIEHRWSGETNFAFGSDGVRFTVPVGGPKGSGMLDGRAHESDVGWVIDELALRAGGEWIDVLADDG